MSYLWRPVIQSRRWSWLVRIISYWVILILTLVGLAAGQKLINQRLMNTETETIAVGQEKIRDEVLHRLESLITKIDQAQTIGVMVEPFQEKLVIINKLIFQDRAWLAASNEINEQTKAIDLLIDQQMTTNAEGILAGTVREGSTNLSGVVVSLKEATPETVSATTGTDGKYSLIAKSGSYTLLASKSGYATFSKTITIIAKQTLTQDIGLTKAQPKAVAPPISTSLTNGDSQYQVLTVSAGGVNYTVNLATFNLASGQFQVITDTANDNDCTDSCPTKSLSSYVSERGGFAGMNGTYFCPVDYASCAGKTGSFYWKVWNSRLSKMINGSNGAFIYEPFLTFNGNTARYYTSWSDFSGGITAGISSSPGLVTNGQNTLDESKLDDKQRTVKSNRGAMGLKGQTLYLAIAKSATVIDLAKIMDALDVDSAMNVDGGGSSAMIFNNSYKVGPGRSIPNAIIIAKR